MDTNLLMKHLRENQLRELDEMIKERDRETEFEKKVRQALEGQLTHFSKPIAALFEAGTSEHADLLLVNNGEEVWFDERFEGAALYALDRIRASVRNVIETNFDVYLEDLGHSLAGILMEEKPSKKKPRSPKKRRG